MESDIAMDNEVFRLCRAYGVVRETRETHEHYALSAGRGTSDECHTDVLFDFSQGFLHVDFLQTLGWRMFRLLREAGLVGNVDVMVVPAPVGILLGAEIQRYFSFEDQKPKLFYAEKTVTRGGWHFRACFRFMPSAKLVLLDDVYTTGSSLRAIEQLCVSLEPSVQIIAKVAIINRRADAFPTAQEQAKAPHLFLASCAAASVLAGDCPWCRDKIPLLY